MIKSLIQKNKTVVPVVLPWILLCLFLNIKYYQDGDINALSRYATMRAMSMEGTFQIDKVKWSMDWSQAEDGHYYSNKAPGPMLAGYPVFWLIDHIKLLVDDNFKKDYWRKETLGYEHKVLIPLLFQIVPMCLLVFFLAMYLQSTGVKPVAITFMTVAILFGNTASLLMTTWFGHGFAACLVLGLFLAIFYQKWMLSGLLLGFAILSDYSVGLFTPGLIIYLLYTDQLKNQVVGKIIIGGLLPGILWLWYHWTNFGGPLSLPNMYQNPKFGGDSIARQFHLIPIPYFMLVLLFGDERGLLFTQPWVLFIVAVSIWYLFQNRLDKVLKPLFIAVLISFMLLLIMNAAFTGWHGGSTPGPRYLSVILPVFGILTAMVYDKLSPMSRHLMWISLAISVVFGGLVYGTTILAYEYYTIWTWLLDYLADGKGDGLRIFIYFISFAAVTIYTFKINLNVSKTDIYN